MKTINYAKEMSLGMGFDSVTGQVRDRALKFDGAQPAVGTGLGQERIATLKMIETQESFLEELEISSEVSAGYGIFSGSVKMDLAESKSINEYTIHVLAKSSIKNPPLTMANPRLTDAALDCYQNDPEDFRRIYGDCYVERMIDGGEYFGLFTFSARDASSHQKLKVGLKVSVGSFLTGGVDAKMDFSSATASVQSEVNTEVLEIVSGGDMPNKTTAEGIVASYQGFPAAVAQHPVTHKVYIKEYLGLLPSGPNWIEQALRKDIIQTCGLNLMNGIQARNKIWFVLAHQDQFSPGYDFVGLQLALEELNARLTEWRDLARRCASDAAQCDPGAIPPVPVIEWPERVETFDPLQEKWEEIKNHWEPQYLRYFRDEYHPSNHPMHSSNPDWPGYYSNEKGRYLIFYMPLEAKHKPISGIFSHPKHGTHAVWGGIFAEYFKRGHCQGPLGFPKADEQYMSGGDGDRISLFENGLLWWDKQTGAVSDTIALKPVNPNVLLAINAWAIPKP